MEQDMTQGHPLLVIFKFTIPLLIGNVFQQMYNMVDTIIVGRYVGEKALAAVGSTGTVMFLIIGFSMGMTAGFTVLTAQRYGAGDVDGVRRSVANGIILAALTTLVMTLLSLAALPTILRLMNTPEDIYGNAYTYIRIICLGLGLNIAYNLLASFLRAIGNSRVPLYFLIMSASLNVALDLLLIIQFKMGVAGAAWATNLSQMIAGIGCLLYIYRRSPSLRPQRAHWRLHPCDTRHQLRMGIPMALQFGITASGTMIMQSAINLFGSTAVAAYTAASKVQGLLTQGMVAMGQTMATYSGQNFGRGDVHRIHQGVRAAVITELIYSAAAALCVMLLLRPMLGLFFADGASLDAMIPWARTYLGLCVLFYMPLSVIFIFRNVMQGCGYGFLPMMGGVVELLARLVAAMLAIETMSFTLASACDPAAWLSAAVFTGLSYRYVIRDIRRRRRSGSL